jgi:glycerophosphoryl diester phosphodiesterase
VYPDSRYAKQWPLQKPADGERFATLGQLVELMKSAGRPVRLNLETKITPASGTDAPDRALFARLVIDELRRMGMVDRAAVQSFD